MRLFEISDALEQVMAAGIDRETGEINDETIAALDGLEMQLEAKCLSLAAYIKGLLAEAKAVKNESKKLADRAQVHTNQAERLIQYMADNFPEDAAKISDARSVIQWVKNPPKVEIDEHAITPADLCTWIPASHKPNKVKIKEALNGGMKIKGHRMVRGTRLSIT